MNEITMSECCEGLFTELVKCYEEDGWFKAWGWTTSSGQTGQWIYYPPSPWEYDPDYQDERGQIGSHGGCFYCMMTLVHLRKWVGAEEEEPSISPLIAVGIGIGLLLLLAGRR